MSEEGVRDMEQFVNRSALIIKPTEKLISWLKSVDPTITDSECDYILKVAGTVYLVDEINTGQKKEIETIIENRYKFILQHELFSLVPDESKWQEKITYQFFNEFFDVTSIGEVIDVFENPIQKW